MRRQTYGYLPSHRASPLVDMYQLRLAEAHVCNQPADGGYMKTDLCRITYFDHLSLLLFELMSYFPHDKIYFFTARRYASAVLAVAWCLSLSLQ